MVSPYRGRARVAALAALAASAPAIARGDPPARPIAEALSVEGANPCVALEPIAAHARAWLRREQIDARLALDVRGGADQDGPVAFAVRRDGVVVAERRFERLPGDCSAQRAALGLALALAIDATVLDAFGAPPPAVRASPAGPGATAPRGSAPGRAHRAGAGATRPRAELPALGARAEAGVTADVVPGVAWGAYAGAELLWPAGLSVRLGALATSRLRVALGPGAVEVALLAARGDVCLARALSRVPEVGVRACAGFAAGQVAAQGVGFDASRAAVIPWAGPIERLEVYAVLAGRVTVHVGGDAVAAVLQPTLVVLGSDGEVQHERAFPVAGAAVHGGVGIALW